MTTIEYSERQGIALQNPADRSEGQPVPPHPDTSRPEGKWRTILETGKLPKFGWLWMASVSRSRGTGRKPYKVGQWKAEWFEEADRILAELLEGVGGERLDAGAMMGDGFEKGLAGYHSWCTMTANEILMLQGVHERKAP